MINIRGRKTKFGWDEGSSPGAGVVQAEVEVTAPCAITSRLVREREAAQASMNVVLVREPHRPKVMWRWSVPFSTQLANWHRGIGSSGDRVLLRSLDGGGLLPNA